MAGLIYENMVADPEREVRALGQVYRFAACTTQVRGHEPYVIPITPHTSL